jgi:hypothetical protein
MPWIGNVLDDLVVPSAARTTSSQTVSGESWDKIEDIRAQIDVTAASGTTPNLAAFVETTIDGTNWDVVGTFAAKTGVAREVITINNFVGRQLRVRWAITGTTPSFTFSVRLQGEK